MTATEQQSDEQIKDLQDRIRELERKQDGLHDTINFLLALIEPTAQGANMGLKAFNCLTKNPPATPVEKEPDYSVKIHKELIRTWNELLEHLKEHNEGVLERRKGRFDTLEI